MPRKDAQPTKDLLDRAAGLRVSIDWRRAELVKGKPGLDRPLRAAQLWCMENDLARIERQIVQRGKAVERALKHEVVEDAGSHPAFD
jgi:hypothetical protein